MITRILIKELHKNKSNSAELTMSLLSLASKVRNIL